MKQLLTRKQWADLAQKKELPPEAGILKGGVRKAINEEQRTVDFIISTASRDREGDTINQQGWELTEYRSNPIVCWAHETGSRVKSARPPIAQSTREDVTEEGLVSTAKFPEMGIYAFADLIFNLIKGEFLRASSVGFYPEEWEIVDYPDGGWGFRFVRQKLWEWSVVPIPANPDALVQARSAGLDTTPLVEWAEQVLDGEPEASKILIPRADLEQLRKDADPKRRVTTGPTEREQTLERQLASLQAQKQALERRLQVAEIRAKR